MDITLSPAAMSGRIRAIPSKSDAHRLLICAALSDKPTGIVIPQSSEDIKATVRCLNALGADITDREGLVKVVPIDAPAQNPLLDCAESGSTLRFMLPVAAALCEKVSFTGGGRLPERPLGQLVESMKAHGVEFSSDRLPFTVSGGMNGGKFHIAGDVSSQYITGLLLSLPLMNGGEIELTTQLASSGYVDITIGAMRRFGVSVKKTDKGYRIGPNERYMPPMDKIEVEGDWSNAAFFLAAGALSGEITVSGLNLNSPQGDKQIVGMLRRFGAAVTENRMENTVNARPAKLRGCEIDVGDIPDMLPILAVIAANAEGVTRFINAGRLRYKECDRLSATAGVINNLGGRAQELPDELVVFGKPLTGGRVDGCNDHRIVMAAAIAALTCSGDVTITGAQAVSKSYPAFFEHYAMLTDNKESKHHQEAL